MFATIVALLDSLKCRRAPRLVEVIADNVGVRTVFDDGSATLAFQWMDVVEVRTFKRDLGIVDDIRLAFHARDFWHEFGEDLKGFEQLWEAMREAFPAIPPDWYMEVMFPPFATNERVLFRREASDVDARRL